MSKSAPVVLFSLFFFLVCVNSVSAAAENPGIPLSTNTVSSGLSWPIENNKAFKVGENLSFNIRWQFITVGSASMEVEDIEEINGRKAYHIVTKARSAQFFDNFYKVRDTNESWMDVESLVSHKFISRISEGKYKRDETIRIDQEKRTFTIEESGKSGDVPLWVRDVLSSLYYIRTRELAEGTEHCIDAHSGDKSWPLKVKVLGKEKVETPVGTFECTVVEPSIRENAGIFRQMGTLKVWLTDDDRKIPVLMRSKVAVGSIEARLVEIKPQ